MNKKELYIKSMLIENISTANNTIDELRNELIDIYKLPNNCYDIDIDGEICKNNDYKIDLLTNHQHVIGYFEALRALSNEIISLNNMNEEEFEKYLIEQEEIQKHNQEEFKKLDEIMKSSTKNK